MLSLSHTGVQTLLFSLCKGCSFKEPGETACGHSPEGTSCSVRGHAGSHPVGEESQVATQCFGGKQAGGPIPASQSTSS